MDKGGIRARKQLSFKVSVYFNVRLSLGHYICEFSFQSIITLRNNDLNSMTVSCLQPSNVMLCDV